MNLVLKKCYRQCPTEGIFYNLTYTEDTHTVFVLDVCEYALPFFYLCTEKEYLRRKKEYTSLNCPRGHFMPTVVRS